MMKPKFVINEHWARHHHFDLRLEMGGVLKSWAIPKDIPKKENEKRLAIEVENHNISYGNFEGEIKEGYGKGKVRIWDKGSYELESLNPNKKIVVNIKGKKLNGKYCLLHFKHKEKNWLFFKVKE